VRARAAAPYLLSGLETYSTLLWHLDRPVALSTLAQELMTLDPLSAPAWLAAGNVFSRLEDHANALKCFKRAVQVDQVRTAAAAAASGGGGGGTAGSSGGVYAHTLAGHECVTLEEWEKALGCYREALRKDRRHYNAW
jgi:anaphase-promoting complex subunit 3